MISKQVALDLLSKYKVSNLLTAIFACSSVAFTYLIYSEIVHIDTTSSPDPNAVMSFMLLDLISLLGLAVLLVRKVFRRWIGSKYDGSGTRLQNRIVLMFCLVAVVPTIVMSIFSDYFFNFGMQSWFDKKVNTALMQSVEVGQAYIAEHRIQMKSTAVSIVDDLGEMYYKLIHDPELFNKVLNAQAEMRSLDEAIVFQPETNSVLAQTSMSFALSFASIAPHLIEKADKGEVVEIKTDPTKIRMLIKLQEYSDSYLLIGRLIDKKIIDHIDKTHGAASEYMRLKTNIIALQIKFSLIFILGALILLFIAIISGMLFAANIVKPIKRLVLATELVKQGDLSASVPEGPKDDELSILSAAFNRMVKQIDHQQKDLIVAQRALAWSDVARRVAHEIKNPLTPIQLSAERLGKKFASQVHDSEEFRTYVDTILRHAQDIGKIVADFVSFAKMPNPTFKVVDLVKVIKDLVDSRRIINDQITYHFNSQFDKLEFICDITQINQVMLNLLKNAEEALEVVQEKSITIQIELNNNLLSLVVSDSGLGISPDMIDRITEPYVTTRTKGTGLGLAIVQKIIQDHAGVLEISNDNGAKIKLVFDMDQLSKKI